MSYRHLLVPLLLLLLITGLKGLFDQESGTAQPEPPPVIETKDAGADQGEEPEGNLAINDVAEKQKDGAAHSTPASKRKVEQRGN